MIIDEKHPNAMNILILDPIKHKLLGGVKSIDTKTMDAIVYKMQGEKGSIASKIRGEEKMNLKHCLIAIRTHINHENYSSELKIGTRGILLSLNPSDDLIKNSSSTLELKYVNELINNRSLLRCVHHEQGRWLVEETEKCNPETYVAFTLGYWMGIIQDYSNI